MKDWLCLLQKKEFPRSNQYDLEWVLNNQMGPNALWLTEWLCEELTLNPEMKILDLGCGRALSSIFLAREFGVKVWAADLWISPDQNWERVLEAGQENNVYPLRAEAHALPFPKNFFDAVISIDSYSYFGTDVLYLGYLSRFIKEGGMVGAAMPGLMRPFNNMIPRHLLQPQANGKVFWEEDCLSFKTPDWWQKLWGNNPSVSEVRTDIMSEGWKHWRDFDRALEITGKNIFPVDVEALEADQGQYIGFIRVCAQKSGKEAINLYDPSLGIQHGIDG